MKWLWLIHPTVPSRFGVQFASRVRQHEAEGSDKELNLVKDFSVRCLLIVGQVHASERRRLVDIVSRLQCENEVLVICNCAVID